ncbi:MAG: hypothetical protein ABII88_06750 [Candidatus Omnitrophota bacterium]
MNKEYPLMVRVIEEKIELYAESRMQSSIIKMLEIGTVLYLGKTIKKDGKQWVETMVGNEKGFISGDAVVFAIKKAKLNQKDADVYEKPSSGAKIKEKYKQNKEFYVTDKVTLGGKEWVKIRDLSNNAGYILGETRVEFIEPLPDVRSDLGSWGFGLIGIGIVSNLIPNFLDAKWGIMVIILGAIILAVRKRFMYIVIAGALIIVGLRNLLGGGSGWTVFGVMQIYWGIQEIQKFWKYKKLEEKGDEDKNILLSIEQEETEIEAEIEPEDNIYEETVEAEESSYQEKPLVEVIDGIWSCPECGVKSRADSEVCDECGQSVVLDS